jgi:hypothetical protein
MPSRALRPATKRLGSNRHFRDCKPHANCRPAAFISGRPAWREPAATEVYAFLAAPTDGTYFDARC